MRPKDASLTPELVKRMLDSLKADGKYPVPLPPVVVVSPKKADLLRGLWHKIKEGKPMDKDKRAEFQTDLTALLNRHSLENGSDTPDFILADYLMGCLDAFNDSLHRREKWHGRKVGDDGEPTP